MSVWKATHHQRKDFLAISRAEKNSLVLGRQKWVIYNDSDECSQISPYTRVLKLTGCSKEEFTCDNGSCVPMSSRCDGKSDCSDEADEAECKAFIQILGYDPFKSPPPMSNQAKHVVRYSFDIKNIFEINEKDGNFRCLVSMKRNWFDRRVTFQNLKSNSSTNMINPEDQSLLWKPYTIFNNIEDTTKFNKADRRDEWKVVPISNTSFVLADKSFLHNTYLSEGASNMISFEIAKKSLR